MLRRRNVTFSSPVRPEYEKRPWAYVRDVTFTGCGAAREPLQPVGVGGEAATVARRVGAGRPEKQRSCVTEPSSLIVRAWYTVSFYDRRPLGRRPGRHCRTHECDTGNARKDLIRRCLRLTGAFAPHAPALTPGRMSRRRAPVRMRERAPPGADPQCASHNTTGRNADLPTRSRLACAAIGAGLPISLAELKTIDPDQWARSTWNMSCNAIKRPRRPSING
jgi:hypothetical protein